MDATPPPSDGLSAPSSSQKENNGMEGSESGVRQSVVTPTNIAGSGLSRERSPSVVLLPRFPSPDGEASHGLADDPNQGLQQIRDLLQQGNRPVFDNTGGDNGNLASGPAPPQEQEEDSIFVKDEPDLGFREDTAMNVINVQAANNLNGDSDTDIGDDNASEFDPADHSDSDQVEPSSASAKPGQSISGEEVSKKISSLVEQLMTTKNKLIIKSEQTGLTEEEEKHLDCIEGLVAQTQARANSKVKATNKRPTARKPRRKCIKNVREYFERKHREENEKGAERQEKKRKQEAQGGAPKKTKTTPKQHLHGAAEQNAIQLRGRIFHSLNDVEDNIAEGSIPTMASFQATTKKDQWKHLKESIPEGCDIRRVNTQAKDLDDASKMFGRRKVKAVDSTWLLNGMNYPLLDYQLAAVGWIMSRENGRTAPYGGILADAPGLGKTVISLAAIIGNPPYGQEDKDYCQATLVVVPNKDIANQWHDEVKKHCKDPLATWVLVWSQSKDIPMGQLKSQWIVITTYNEIMAQLPKAKDIQKLKSKCGEDVVRFEQELNRASGALLQVNWYRIILDEAHQIKNHKARVTLGCWQLKSKYRWALTGTPLSNKLEEIFPYLKFIGCNFTTTLNDFAATYLGSDSNNDNLETLISMIMMRRTNQDTFMGHRVLLLPSAHSHDIKISLSVKEEIIYEAVHLYYERIIRAMQRMMSAGYGDKDMAQRIERTRLARQTRLRQVTSHPFTVEKIIQERFREDDILGIRRAHNQTKALLPVLESLKEGDKMSNGLSKFTNGLNLLEAMDDDAFGGNFDMDILLKLAQNESSIRGIPCGLCGKNNPPVKPMRSSNCDHVFCEICLIKAVTSAKTTLAGEKKVACPVENCQEQLGIGADIETLVTIQEEAKLASGFKEPGRDINNARLARKPNDNGFFLASCRTIGVSLPPIFTQFIMTGKVLGRMLEKAGIKFAYYYGSGFSPKQREKAIKTFKYDDECTVLIAGLGCGAQSLNLTVANRVIIVEPWWNKTREQQAFGRVHRIGQEKECYLVRILTQEYVDSRISELQDQKAEVIDRALQDDGHVPTILNDMQLRYLFDPQQGREDANNLKNQLREAQELELAGQELEELEIDGED
ncbi:hypothetical protein FSARC_3988 [Fusarium sarcochroum]|uniref:Uncharacterized protein n=1 Tax=Fusarium sarcochroum TaxID=1208366 RepID=A0A8H4U371_9HYPO|nr:hypothetical protein FSARC_3988 [Fusarium sarcochroum]